MTLAYFDCFAGSGGDMIVAALLDAGADFSALREGLSSLGLAGLDIGVEKVTRNGLVGSRFVVQVPHEHAHRHLGDILAMIAQSSLPSRAKDRAERVFRRLAEAEAKVHGTSIEEVHFHEVGAADSIADVVGACLAMELLGVDAMACSAVPVGHGIVRCEHGEFPIPAPAVAELLKGFPIAESDIEGELTTPTAAAVFTALAESFGPVPAMTISSIGYGAGTRENPRVPNLLRVILGQPDESGAADSVVELSANIDDCTGEILGSTIEKLLAAGCLDAWATPIVMKKSRPAWMLSTLCGMGDAAAASNIIFRETTTFGIRRRTCGRLKLSRRHEVVETAYGPIRVKLGFLGETLVTASPEFSDCLAAAEAHHASVKEVMQVAEMLYRQGRPS